MKKIFKLSETAFQMDGKMPLSQAIPLGLQHVLAMFVGNLTQAVMKRLKFDEGKLRGRIC